MYNVQGRMMWNAWTEEKSKSKLKATNEFIILSTQLLDKLGVNYKVPANL